MFAYDPASSLTVASASVAAGSPAEPQALFDRLRETSAHAQAWLILPSRTHPVPFVILLHGGGQDSGACLPEAGLLADLGIAALLVDLPQARALPDFSNPGRDRATLIETVTTVRRGLDYIALRPDIDSRYGAVVGFSFGAWIGSLAAGVDPRLRAAVLIAAVPRMSEFWRSSPHPHIAEIRGTLPQGAMQHYAECFQPLDAVEHLPRCSDLHLFLQFGTVDEAIPESSVAEFAPFVRNFSRLQRYETASHYEMSLHPGARLDRLQWLKDELSA